MKQCSKCKSIKHRDNFCKRPRSKDGLQSWCRKCQLVKSRDWYARQTTLGGKKRYGQLLERGVKISREQFEELHPRRRTDLCEICGRRPKELLAIDHNHTTGTVRGLLCRRCNLGISLFDEDPATFKAAVTYLDKYK